MVLSFYYTIETGSAAQRSLVESWLPGFELIAPETKAKVITAWVTMWLNSPFETLEEMIYSPAAPAYPLMYHVQEVVRFGIDLAKSASKQWGEDVEWEQLVPILMLHDVDKPLMFVRTGPDQAAWSDISANIQHGVLGAFLLKDLGFSEKVISTVALHATNSPYHGSNPEAYILHYADLFSSDHALMLAGSQPFYQKHWK